MRTLRASATPLSATKEDYLRAVYLLAQHPPVGVTEVAKRLNLSKSTVSERVRELVNDGLLIAEPYGSITLTPKGMNEGKKLTYKHRIIEVFLHNTLKLSKDKVHVEAERLEHAFSDEVIKKLANFLGNPLHDPHGSVIPKNVDWNRDKKH